MTTTAQNPTVQDVYTKVTERIISLLEKGVIPWRKTWSTYGLARNYATGHVYTGINMILMNNTEHPIPYFMTFNQVKTRNGKIKKGAKAEFVVYFNVVFKNEQNQTIEREEAEKLQKQGKEVKVQRYLKYFNVFNTADIEGIEFEFPEIKFQPNEKIEKCESIIQNMPNCPDVIQQDVNRAYYDPTHDIVNLPAIEQFESAEHFYTTFFHELAHATGHESRLARPAITNPNEFGSKAYSEEELTAEIAAAFLCAQVGIDYDDIMENTAAYLQGWLKILKKDKLFIFKAAAAAQKATDYILGK